jgi:hypothetical protein
VRIFSVAVGFMAIINEPLNLSLFAYLYVYSKNTVFAKQNKITGITVIGLPLYKLYPSPNATGAQPKKCHLESILGHAVAPLVEALRYKSECRGFDSRWSH